MLSKFIFFDGNSAVVCTEAMTFGAGVELAIAMPLSWLPLISDYTREAEDPVKASLVSSIVYGIVSCWMYLIGSVFAPMIAIQIADFFILKNDKRNVEFDVLNLVLWLVGFVVYRCFMQIDTPVGNTIPCMIITILLSVVIHKIIKKNN